MSEEFKPCPFCGSTIQSNLGPTCQKNDPYNPNSRAFPIIRCCGCFTDVPGRDWDNSGRSAIEAWNRRSNTPIQTTVGIEKHRCAIAFLLEVIDYMIETTGEKLDAEDETVIAEMRREAGAPFAALSTPSPAVVSVTAEVDQ